MKKVKKLQTLTNEVQKKNKAKQKKTKKVLPCRKTYNGHPKEKIRKSKYTQKIHRIA